METHLGGEYAHTDNYSRIIILWKSLKCTQKRGKYSLYMSCSRIDLHIMPEIIFMTYPQLLIHILYEQKNFHIVSVYKLFLHTSPLYTRPQPTAAYVFLFS